MKYTKHFIGICILFITMSLSAQSMWIVTPYLGTLKNHLEMDANPLKDDAIMAGLYVQFMNPEQYQWNAFLYGSRDINESDLLGTHFILDKYLNPQQSGMWAIGAGFDWIQIKTKADNLGTLQNFSMSNNIYAPYIRGGRYLNFGSKNLKHSVFPWIGYEHDILQGDLSFNLPSFAPGMPPQSINESLNDTYSFALAGITFSSTLYHFIQIKLKYHVKIDLNHDEMHDQISGLVNLFATRKIGLSYRFKYMEEVIGKNTYHIGGVAFVL